MTAPAIYPLLRSVKDLLVDADLRVGDGVAPKSTNGDIVTPCAVVHLQPSTSWGDSVCEPGRDVRLTLRVISVDITQDGAIDYADRVNAALLGVTPVAEGHSTNPIRWVESTHAERDDDVSPPCFYVSALYSIMSNYAPEES